MSEKFAIETKGVKVSINGRSILHGVDLKVTRGDIVALIGPNGAGKTTLLRALLGLQKIDSGEINILGETDMSKVFDRIGYVPQRLPLDKSFILSVREFLSLRLESCRHWFWSRHRRLDEALVESLPGLEIYSLLDCPMSGLSGGQLQKVLIAFSLLRKPELLLLDEPTAGVDAPGEESFYELVEGIHQKLGLTVVLVSHDLSMVCRYASWVYALNGVLCCEGPPQQIMNADSLKQAYGIHVSPYEHHHHVH